MTVFHQNRKNQPKNKIRPEALTYWVVRRCFALIALVSVLVFLDLQRFGGVHVSQKDLPRFFEMIEHVAAAALLCPALGLLLDLVLKRSGKNSD